MNQIFRLDMQHLVPTEFAHPLLCTQREMTPWVFITRASIVLQMAWRENA